MKLRWTIVIVVALALCFGAAWMITPDESQFKTAGFYQKTASPGKLSAAHAHLGNNCAACHTPFRGIETAKCIACHANAISVLQRQPTAFHSSVSSCKECHREHQGIEYRPTIMDHEALVQIGRRQLKSGTDSHDKAESHHEQFARAQGATVPYADISISEKLLNCVSCHSNDDRHFKLFGRNCASCHATDRWMISNFKHPSPNSRDCAQCHQAPPSHYMLHFKMISQRVAGKHRARVDQCFSCHQTTSWNDIKNAGWYKHH